MVHAAISRVPWMEDVDELTWDLNDRTVWTVDLMSRNLVRIKIAFAGGEAYFGQPITYRIKWPSFDICNY
jgi:hypothetical protein